MIESIPVAVRLNELGYDVVIPNYRIGMERVMPKPLEDVAATYRAALALRSGVYCRHHVWAGCDRRRYCPLRRACAP